MAVVNRSYLKASPLIKVAMSGIFIFLYDFSIIEIKIVLCGFQIVCTLQPLCEKGKFYSASIPTIKGDTFWWGRGYT